MTSSPAPPSSPLGSNQACPTEAATGRRVRREWRTLSTAEQELFLTTVETALDRGYFKEFLEFHDNAQTAYLSHNTCSFALWHRRFLLAMENVLREMDPPRTSCLTLPYWNVVQDFQRQDDEASCFSYASCSPMVRSMGGVPGFVQDDDDDKQGDGSGIVKNVTTTRARRTFASQTIAGVLIQGRPFTRLKDRHGELGIVRADLWEVPVTQRANYSSIRDLILNHKSYQSFTLQMQRGIHDFVHDTIGGFMPSYASPIDMIFLNWHSTIDLLQSLWMTCHVAQPMTSIDQRLTSPWAFEHDAQTCGRFSSTAVEFPPNPMRPVAAKLSANTTMYIKKQAANTAPEPGLVMDIRNQQDIMDNDVIGPYFRPESNAGLGTRYFEVTDARVLGAHYSFTYELPESSPLWYDLLNSKCPTATAVNSVGHRDFVIVQQDEEEAEYNQDPISFAASEAPAGVHDYRVLDKQVRGWIYEIRQELNINPLNAPDDKTLLHYLSCVLLHTEGRALEPFVTSTAAVGQVVDWQGFVHQYDIRQQADDVVVNGPQRCAFLVVPTTTQNKEPQGPTSGGGSYPIDAGAKNKVGPSTTTSDAARLSSRQEYGWDMSLAVVLLLLVWRVVRSV